jgi:hypothetical protein
MKKEAKRQPYFVRFLESQELARVSGSVFVTLKYPSDDDENPVTLKYPSDDDEGPVTLKYPSDDDETF